MAQVTVQNRLGENEGCFTGNAEESLGVQAQDEGIPVPFSCGVGACRTCMCTVLEGLEHIDREAVGPQQIPTEEDAILSCIASLREDTPPDAQVTLRSENL
ncbi:2Fe-2S iron-sulfur cluster binding domain-containing protein [Candidatus Peribacteria bacterium]|nr:2Fe-2S iron-sulfur cluster binding domain-containing protein [Candidatus Peribacteria bacterium]